MPGTGALWEEDINWPSFFGELLSNDCSLKYLEKKFTKLITLVITQGWDYGCKFTF